jgi:hypothetical protein
MPASAVGPVRRSGISMRIGPKSIMTGVFSSLQAATAAQWFVSHLCIITSARSDVCAGPDTGVAWPGFGLLSCGLAAAGLLVVMCHGAVGLILGDGVRSNRPGSTLGRLPPPAAIASGADRDESVLRRIPRERLPEGATLSPVGCAGFPRLQAAPNAREGLLARRFRGACAPGA